jgi:uncharacterized membrane protein YgcG
VAAGEAFSFVAQQRLDEAVAAFESHTGMSASVYVGSTDGGPEPFADAAVAELPDQERGLLLIVVDPGRRQMAIRTVGPAAARLTDEACALAVLSMTTSFGVGDLVGGVVQGLRMLSDASVTPLTRHGRPAPTSSTVTAG